MADLLTDQELAEYQHLNDRGTLNIARLLAHVAALRADLHTALSTCELQAARLDYITKRRDELRADLDAATQTITAQAEVLRHTRDALTVALHKWADTE